MVLVVAGTGADDDERAGRLAAKLAEGGARVAVFRAQGDHDADAAAVIALVGELYERRPS